MTAQSIVCGACAAEVPNGRLSCPSCGELLASVAGSRRVAAPAGARSAIPDVLYEPPAAPSAAVVDGQLTLEKAPRDVEAELPWAETTTEAAGTAAAAHLAEHSTPSMAVPFGTAASLNGSRTPAYMPRPRDASDRATDLVVRTGTGADAGSTVRSQRDPCRGRGGCTGRRTSSAGRPAG